MPHHLLFYGKGSLNIYGDDVACTDADIGPMGFECLSKLYIYNTNIINRWVSVSGSVCVCLCQHQVWTPPTEPIQMKLGVKIPCDARVVCSSSIGNTSFTNE